MLIKLLLLTSILTMKLVLVLIWIIAGVIFFSNVGVDVDLMVDIDDAFVVDVNIDVDPAGWCCKCCC